MPRGNVRVSITADADGVRRGTKEAERHLDRFSKSGATKLKGLAKAAAGAAVAYASIAEAKDAVNVTTDLAKATIGLNKNLGLSVKTASEWAAVAKVRGIETKALNMAFGTLAKNADKATQGTDAQVEAFKRLGITQAELKKLKFNELLGEAADGLKNMEPGAKKTSTAMQLFGRGWQTIVPVLRDGSKAMQEQLDLAQKYGATFSGGSIKTMKDLIAAQREAKFATLGLQVAFGTQLAPVLTSVIGKVSGFVAEMRSGKGEGGKFADTVKDIAEAFKPAVTAFVDAAKWAKKFADEHPGIAKVAVQVGLVAAAFKVFKIGTAVRAVKNFTDAAIATPGAVKNALSGVKGIFTRVFGAAGTAGGTTAAEKAASGIMGTFPTKEGRMKATTRSVMTRVGKAGGIAMTAGVILGLAALSAGIGHELNKAKTDIIDPWVKKNFGKAGSVYTDIRDFIGRNLPDAVPGAPLLREIFGEGMGRPIADFMLESFNPFSGPLGNKGAKNVDAFGAIASRFGLTMTSGYRSGDPGWHGQNRARDYSNSSHPTPQMMDFARFMAANYGGKLLELIYSPLGFSIKNGQKTAPYAVADHFDHVHVAMQRGGMVPGRGTGDKVPVLAEPGEGFLNSRLVRAMGGKRAIDALNAMVPRFQGGGVVVAAKAAKAAGFSGNKLIRMVAEAGGETGGTWNPAAVGDSGNSIGLWQIHLPSHPWARGLNLRDPYVNARAAMRVFKDAGGSFGPWHADHTPYMDDARQAVASIGGPGAIQEDDPRFNWATMGNKRRGVFIKGQKKRRVVTAREFAQLDRDRKIDWRRTTPMLGDDAARRSVTYGRGKQVKSAPLEGRDIVNIGQEKGGDFFGPGTGDTGVGGDPNQPLIDAINQQTAATEAHTQAVSELRAQQARNETLILTQGRALTAGLIQMVNGGIGGNAGLGRMFPSSVGLGGLSRA